MDVVLCRLQSIRRSLEIVNTLSAEGEKKIQKQLLNIHKILNSRETSDEERKKARHEVLLMLNEIESFLYTPVVSHLITCLNTKGKEQENCTPYDMELKQEVSASPSQNAEVKEKLAKVSEKIRVDQESKGLGDYYWEVKKSRIHSLLGDSSLRFDNRSLARSQWKSSSSDFRSTITDVQLSTKDPDISHVSRSSRKHAQKYSQKFIDAFWGLDEDKCIVKDKKWKNGETICVLNCKSELRKLTEFLKQRKEVCSFFIERKPKGQAGCKGTWLTPAYSPPLVVKYGSPAKR